MSACRGTAAVDGEQKTFCRRGHSILVVRWLSRGATFGATKAFAKKMTVISGVYHYHSAQWQSEAGGREGNVLSVRLTGTHNRSYSYSGYDLFYSRGRVSALELKHEGYHDSLLLSGTQFSEKVNGEEIGWSIAGIPMSQLRGGSISGEGLLQKKIPRPGPIRTKLGLPNRQCLN